MPLYEYTCPACEDQFELLIRGSEQAACPKCGSGQLVKHFSAPAAHVRGGVSLPLAGKPMRDDGTCGMPACCRGKCSS